MIPEELRPVPEDVPVFRELPDEQPQWVRPTVVVEVEYRRRLRDGLRHAALKGVRPDRQPGLIQRQPKRPG